MNQKRAGKMGWLLWIFMAALGAAFLWIVWHEIPWANVRYSLTAVIVGMFILFLLLSFRQRRQIAFFADTLCETMDRLMADHKMEQYQPYDDSLTSKVQEKMIQFYDRANETKRQSQRERETLQAIVSDISHQVKTPVANIRMFAGILQRHELSEEKRQEFLGTMEGQINKLDFLMQSLIKMSRLETGTFELHPKTAPINSTIASAVSLIWTKADKKGIQLSAECDSDIVVKHDPKWTAEALGNILDNAVKYTPSGGQVTVKVRPWQMYTRIDISDTGIGIAEEHYHDIFKRFYRAEEVAGEEGVGLGLYLAQEIIQLQMGYMTVRSRQGEGTTFSVFLLS